MRCLIGIDDTDNTDSRGTGFRARQLGARFEETGLGRMHGITRHQLFVHPSIPYTSHNSSACLDIEIDAGRYDDVIAQCRQFLREQSAPGSDAGFCVAAHDEMAESLVGFGRAAKTTILSQAQAAYVAAECRVHLEGCTGDHGGIIGALSAVGLRRSGEDGRFIWLPGVRELSGTETAARLLATTGIELIQTQSGDEIPGQARICVDPWPRPVLLGGRAVLLAKEAEEANVGYGWEILSREAIRRY